MPILVMLLLLPACDRVNAADGPVRVGFIVEEVGGESALRGAELGAEEAAHAAELVGGGFLLLTETADDEGEVGEAAGRLVDQGVVAILGGFDDESCRALARIAEKSDVLFVNLGCRANALRTDTISRTLHIEASDAMYDSALRRLGSGGVLWHGELSRFGAAQLNERFERRFGSPADGPAWAGWMGIKVLWESLAQVPSGRADQLIEHLAAPTTVFDGHKGEALRFEPRTRQLQQPLFARSIAAEREAAASEAALARHAALPPLSDVTLGAGPYLFVSNEGSHDLTVVDLAAGEAVARIEVGHRPRGIQVDPKGRKVYVALSDDAPLLENDADAVAAIDLETGEVIQRYSVGSDPEQFGFTPNGRLLYAANEDAGTATATEISTGSVLATLVVGIEPEGVALSPDGRWVYVTAETSNTVSVIDTRSNTIVGSFLVDVRPRGVTFAPSGDRAYVTNEISGTLTVVDTRSHRPIGTIELGETAKPVGVVVSPNGARVYVANGHGNSVAVIDAATNQVIAVIPTGRRPWGLASSPAGDRIYSANGGSNDVSEIDTGTLRVVRTFSVGERPWGLTVLPAR